MRAYALVVAFILVACAAPETTRVEETAAASPDALCAEHGVLEALCTQCNPALIPVFRARVDYCEEHGFPESLCPVCHPERGGRPATALTVDDAPPDGLRVRLASPALADVIGIRVEPIVAAPDTMEIAATAHIAYDRARVAMLNARASGVVQSVHVDVGARVEVGAPLLTIASADVAADRARVTAARSRLTIAEANLARRESLSGIVSEREVMDTRRERDEAHAEVSALSASLRVVGGASRGAAYVLTSPIAGVVTELAASIGSFVDSEETLVVVVDPSYVWAELDVREADLSRVRPGLNVRIEVDGLTEPISARLDYLAPAIDPRTRTTRARASLANPQEALRANMYARAFVLVPRQDAAFRVPRDALQRARGATLVFVQVDDGLYEARRVEVVPGDVVPGDGANVDVRGRLEAGENVVVDAAFILRTETLRDSIGAGCCEAD